MTRLGGGTIVWKSRLIRISFIVAIGAAIVLALGALGSRFGILPSSMIGLALLAGALLLSFLALLVGIIGLLWSLVSDRTQLGQAAISVLLAGVVIGIPLSVIGPQLRSGDPTMHDITTDIQNPPEFSAVMPARGESSNSTDYKSKFIAAGPGGDLAGKSYAEVQAEFFPDIKPVVLNLPRDEAFTKALAAAKAQGWEIVSEAPNMGRIEATDTTPWMRFKDDVVIRLTAQGEGITKIDVRSSSRVGEGDMGKNAARVRAYIATLTAE